MITILISILAFYAVVYAFMAVRGMVRVAIGTVREVRENRRMARKYADVPHKFGHNVRTLDRI